MAYPETHLFVEAHELVERTLHVARAQRFNTPESQRAWKLHRLALKRMNRRSVVLVKRLVAEIGYPVS